MIKLFFITILFSLLYVKCTNSKESSVSSLSKESDSLFKLLKNRDYEGVIIKKLIKYDTKVLPQHDSISFENGYTYFIPDEYSPSKKSNYKDTFYIRFSDALLYKNKTIHRKYYSYFIFDKYKKQLDYLFIPCNYLPHGENACKYIDTVCSKKFNLDKGKYYIEIKCYDKLYQKTDVTFRKNYAICSYKDSIKTAKWLVTDDCKFKKVEEWIFKDK